MIDHELLHNKHPLNQAALQWLEPADADPQHPYLLSLAAWGLANGSEGDWPMSENSSRLWHRAWWIRAF
jgi:hypothetical protein